LLSLVKPKKYFVNGPCFNVMSTVLCSGEQQNVLTY